MDRIIVVEDNIIYSDFVCRLLESKGYPSVSTSTCNGARKYAACWKARDTQASAPPPATAHGSCLPR